jgi:hypothetical protein
MAVLSAVHRKLVSRRPWVWTTAASFYCRHAQLVRQCYGEEPEVFFTSLRVLKIRMVSINEELKAAQAAKAVINALSTATRKSAVLATLRTANHAAILNLGSGGALNEARTNVGIALSNLMHGLPTPEKINKANSAMDAWIKELEAAKP